jgi:predicted nucleotidyltransferase
MATVKDIRFSFVEEKILDNLSEVISNEIPEAERIIIFGSRMRGSSDEDSDLDVAVIIDIPVINKEIWERLWGIKWRVLEAMRSEEFPLSLMLITLKDFLNRDFGIEKVIREEGLVLWKR